MLGALSNCVSYLQPTMYLVCVFVRLMWYMYMYMLKPNRIAMLCVGYSYVVVTSVHWPLEGQCTEVTRCNYLVSCKSQLYYQVSRVVHNQIVYEIVTHVPTVSAVCLGIFSTECTEISIVT